MNELPSVLFVVDPKRERIAIGEARKLGIPIVALTDTNCDPDVVDYVVPGNDDALRSIRLFANRIAEGCLLGAHGARQRDQGFVEMSQPGGAADADVPVVMKKRPAGPGEAEQNRG